MVRAPHRRPSRCRRGATTALLAVAALAGVLGCASGWAGAPPRLTDAIPAGALAPALAMLAQRTGVRIVYVSSIATGQTTPGARAGLTAPDALAELLDGTGLEFAYLDARTVRIFRRAARAPADLPAPAWLPVAPGG